VSGKCHTLVGTENNWLENRVNTRSSVGMARRRTVAAQFGTKLALSVHVTVSVLAVLFRNVLAYL
jgi:hypothetical protein